MITVADIFNKPKIEIFPDFGTEKFCRDCRTRENDIKHEISMATRSFNYYVKLFGGDEKHLSKWQEEKAKSCAVNLGGYLEFLLEELDKSKIEDYCRAGEALGDAFIPFLPDMVFLMINSFQGAVETDLHWVSDMVLSDAIDISIGEFDYNKLEKYLPVRIVEIRQLLNALEGVNFIDERSGALNEAISCHESNIQKASNLLLITTIEGIVRSLGSFLAGMQQLQVNLQDKRKYASLEGFLNKIPWKADVQINGIKYGLLTGNYSSYKRSAPDYVWSNLTERLGFLCRRFKDNRNSILHGEETQYANALNSFLNFSALKEVLLTVQEYQAAYNNHISKYKFPDFDEAGRSV